MAKSLFWSESMNKVKIIGIIPARYGSSRFPGKPLAIISGKTLIQRTFERVKLCPLFDEIFVATDDDRIETHLSKFDAKVIMTSKDCINGTERITEAISKVKNLKDDDIIVNVQGDHPLISSETIESTIKVLQTDKLAVMSTAATPINDKDEVLSSHIVKVVFDKSGYALYFSRSPIPYTKDFDKTKYYYHVGIYAYRANFLKKLSSLPPTCNQLSEDLEQLKVLEHGYKIKVALVQEKPLGVDTPQDLTKVEKFLCQ